MSQRLKFSVSYDGGAFAGWQSQLHRKTVQDELERAFQKIGGTHVRVHGAGRTDAGVHALAQVAHVDLPDRKMSGERWTNALNAVLPNTVRISKCLYVSEKFHARFSAKGKTYRYRIYRGKVVPPMLWRYVLHYPFPLDEDAMRAAAARFVGTHDFASFAASTGSEEDDKERSTEREIYSSELARSPDAEELVFTVRGRSFLRYMVRKMIGTLLDVGRGKLQPADIDRLYELREHANSGPPPRPQGLCMVCVEHEESFRISDQLNVR